MRQHPRDAAGKLLREVSGIGHGRRQDAMSILEFPR